MFALIFLNVPLISKIPIGMGLTYFTPLSNIRNSYSLIWKFISFFSIESNTTLIVWHWFVLKYVRYSFDSPHIFMNSNPFIFVLYCIINNIYFINYIKIFYFKFYHYKYNYQNIFIAKVLKNWYYFIIY